MNGDNMPSCFYVQEIRKIIAQRDCHPSRLGNQERRSGPWVENRSREWLILGSFIEKYARVDDDEFPDCSQPWLFWVQEDDLFRSNFLEVKDIVEHINDYSRMLMQHASALAERDWDHYFQPEGEVFSPATPLCSVWRFITSANWLTNTWGEDNL